MTEQARTRTPAAAKTKAAAAVAETTPAPQTIEWRGLTLTVPPISEWGSEMYFLIAEAETGGISTSIRILSELVGAGQLTQVRAKLAEDKVPFAEVEQALSDLSDLIYDTYGTSEGESEASPTS